MLALEPRIVFDGAAVATAIEASDIVADDMPNIINIAEQAGAVSDSNQIGTQVAFIDMSLPDAQQIADGLHAGVTIVWLEPTSDGAEQISTALEALGTVDALHIFTHGDDGSFVLGNQLVTNDTLSEVADDFSDWSQYLSADADILLYGCDIAQTDHGQNLVNSLATLTGADIAASTDLTGASALGGDWHLEYSSGDIETIVAATQMLQANYAHVLPGEPQATLTGPAVDPLIGEQITFNVSFDNINATDPGFAPYINLIMPSLGADGTNAGDSDGISFVSATYLGSAVDANVITLTDIDGGMGGIQFEHPDAVDAAGDPLVITIDPSLGVQEGDQLVVLTLPFGSVTADLPVLDLVITADVSADADVGTGLDVIANAGFKFGNDALDNPATDPSIQATTLNGGTTDTVTITPQLYRLTTTLNAPEGETATGENFERSYDVEIEVATGQTIDTASIDFTFDERMIYTSGSSTGGGVLDITNLGQATGGDLSDDVLTVDFATLSGTQTVTANFYIGEFDQAGANVLDPLTGAAVVVGETNNVELTGSWDPNDVRDAITPISETQTATTITARSLAVQKSVAIQTDTNTTGATPGDTLRYTIDIQVSDYFAFDTITLEDIFEDGQLLTGTPTLDVTRQGSADPQDTFTLGVDLTDTTLGNDDHDLDFDVSALILGGGNLEGGYFGADTLGATTAQIVFDTIIQDEYDSEAGNLNIKQGDTLDNDVTVEGEVLNLALAQVGNQVTDDSSTEITVPNEEVSLSVYALNGTPGAVSNIKPGDDVTFRLEYDLVTGDFENFDISAYLPLPVFDVDDLNADGAGGDAFAEDAVNAVPTVGLFRFGPTATGDVIAGGLPGITPDAVSNALSFDFGDLSDATNDGGTIDILFTLRVTNEPFADNLLLTTLSQQGDDNSPSTTTTSDDLDQITLQQPAIENIIKGVVGTSVNGGDSFTPTYSADDPTTIFKDAGNGDANPLNSTVSSNTLVGTDLDNDLTNGVDDGDLVRFAIIVENTGTSPNGAFDVTIQDTLPAGFVVPGGGINLRVVDGTGATIAVETGSPETALFAGGITLQDGGTGAIGEFSATSGQNIAIITYDLEIDNAAEAAATFTNTATLTNYANTEGGPDFTAEDPTDTADVMVATATVDKTITDTSETSTTGANLVVGEVVEYTVVITVPEGTTSSALLVDTLDAGLAFVGINSITIDSGDLTTDVGGGTATILSGAAFSNVGGGADNDARRVTMNFGNLTNVNTDNTTDETITIVYEAVAVNTADTNNTDTLDNTAVWTSVNDGTGVEDSTTVTIVEPSVTVSVTPDSTEFDVGDTVTWTVVVTAPGGNPVDAFDIDFNNTIPAGLTYVGSSLANTAGVAPTSLTENGGDFNATYASLTPGQTSTFTFQTTVDTGAGFGQTFTNSGTATWHSISGALADPSTLTTVDTERTGSEVGANDYTDTDTGVINILPAAPELTLDSTSETSNGNDVTVGEIVRYRYKMAIPESTTTDLRVEPDIMSGLQFLDDGTATIGFVADGPGITSSTITGAGLSGNEATVDGLEPTIVLASGVDVSAGPFEGGDNPQFLLGDVVNNDSDANQEFVIIEFNVLVLNAAFQDDGDTRTVDARVLTGAATEIFGTADVSEVSVDVVEPELENLDKSVIATDGSTATYQVTFENNSGETAFDVNVLDVLPANLTNLDNVTIVSSTGVTAPIDSSTGTQLDLDLGSMADGGSITITYTADIVDETLVVADTDVDVTWTSIPGTASTLGTSTAGVSGALTGERTSSGLVQNDYAIADGAGLGVINGTLWDDADLNDTIDVGEARIPNVQINLTLGGADGIVGNGDDITLTTLTDVNGEYSFGALPSGPYEISVQPSGQVNGLPSQYSHVFDPTGSGTDNLITGALTEGQNVTARDFGVGIGEISGTLFEDVDASNTNNVGDVLLPNTQIDLLYAGADGIFGNGDDQTFTTITDINGDYTFTGLQPGNYRISVATTGANPLDSIYTSTFDVEGTANDNLIDLALVAGVTEANQDFGVQDLPTPPEGVDRSYTITNDQTLGFPESEFGFTDQDGDPFDNVRIDTLPTEGTLTLNGVPITPGQIIPVADIPGILFTPDTGQVGSVDFTFSVQDDTGSFDLVPNTFTITIAEPVVVLPPVNPPTTPPGVVVSPPGETPEGLPPSEFFVVPDFDYFRNDPFLREITQPDFWLAGNVDQKLVIETEPFVFNVSKGIFKHSRPGEQLTYEAKLADDSPLPDWIEFDSESLTYKGTPPLGSPKALETVIIARDSKGNEVKAPVRIVINREVEEEDRAQPVQVQPDLPVETEGEGKNTEQPTEENQEESGDESEPEDQSSLENEYLNFSEQLQNQTRLSQIQQDMAFLDAISVANPTSGAS